MGLMTKNHMMNAPTRDILGNLNVRCFASDNYPEHIVLEMPNLSPTMEKVSSLLF